STSLPTSSARSTSTTVPPSCTKTWATELNSTARTGALSRKISLVLLPETERTSSYRKTQWKHHASQHPHRPSKASRLGEHRFHRSGDEEYGTNGVGHSRQSTNPQFLGKSDGRPRQRCAREREMLRHHPASDCRLCSCGWNNLQIRALSQAQSNATGGRWGYRRCGTKRQRRPDFVHRGDW